MELVLERLAGRQLVVNRSWQSFHTELVERREVLVQWERTMTETTKVNLFYFDVNLSVNPLTKNNIPTYRTT